MEDPLGARHIPLNALRCGHSPLKTKLPLALALSRFQSLYSNAIRFIACRKSYVVPFIFSACQCLLPVSSHGAFKNI